MRWIGTLTVAVLLLGGLTASVRAADPPPVCCPGPRVSLVLGCAEGTATPCRKCFAHAGGGNVLVTQPAPDTIATSMTGVVVAKGDPLQDSVASYCFDLTQGFEVVIHDPTVHGVKLLMEGRVVGLLRNPKQCCCNPSGSAAISIPGHAAVLCGPTELLAVSLPVRAAACGEEISVYNREGPVCVPVVPGKYTLHEGFGIQASHGRLCLLSKGTSAEFAPDPALDPKWISHWEPFHGANKRHFGFQVILKVVPEDEPLVPASKEEAPPAPKDR